MVKRTGRTLCIRISLSVLALSSRFDGPAMYLLKLSILLNFQYSLCRVVLMVG